MINSVYNYYMTNYVPPSSSRREIHKKSELKSIYNNIININKQLPLYKVSISDSAQKYAISMKESSIALNHFIHSLSDTNSLNSVYKKKVITSSDESIVEANITTDNYEDLPDPFSIHVKELANPQINTGKETFSDLSGIREGSYSFIVNIEDNVYEFQFNVPPDSTNKDIQSKLSKFINKSDIGITSFITKGSSSDTTKMVLKSNNSSSDDNSLVFTLTDVKIASKSQKGLVEYYDLNNVTTIPNKASFLIDDYPMESNSNTFLVNNAIELTLKQPTTQQVYIDYETDSSNILGQLDKFVNTFNDLINIGVENSIEQKSSTRLLKDFFNITLDHSDELESCGVKVESDGTLSIDPALSLQSARDNTLQDLFTNPSGFVQNLHDKSQDLMINPMEYVDKKMITYVNPNRYVFPNPYVTSMYSGMLFNYYC